MVRDATLPRTSDQLASLRNKIINTKLGVSVPIPIAAPIPIPIPTPQTTRASHPFNSGKPLPIPQARDIRHRPPHHATPCAYARGTEWTAELGAPLFLSIDIPSFFSSASASASFPLLSAFCFLLLLLLVHPRAPGPFLFLHLGQHRISTLEQSPSPSPVSATHIQHLFKLLYSILPVEPPATSLRPHAIRSRALLLFVAFFFLPFYLTSPAPAPPVHLPLFKHANAHAFSVPAIRACRCRSSYVPRIPSVQGCARERRPRKKRVCVCPCVCLSVCRSLLTGPQYGGYGGYGELRPGPMPMPMI